MTNNHMTEFLESLSFWNELSPQDQDLLSANLHPVQYKAGQLIHSGEIHCLGTIFVQSGILRTFLSSGDGKETTIYRLREGEVCVLSASCILSSITFDVQIEAETDCDVFLIPAPIFSALMNRNIYVENFAYHLVTERFSDVISAIERMFFMNLKQRIAAFLIDESAARHTENLHLTQEQLAKAIGSAREAVSRNLKQMAGDGCIEIARGIIQIKDKAVLYSYLSND